MKKIVLASNNKHKIKEIKDMLKDYEVLSLNDIEYFDEIEENGTTFSENAIIKAKTISQYLRSKNILLDVISDDSGLYCLGLNGEPGIYSARYSGSHGNDQANRDKLLKNIKDKDRTAYFNCAMCLYHTDDTYEICEGKTYGKIIDKELGKTDFGYDCIFKSDDLNKTFGEATEEEKNSVSHRSRALNKIKELLEEN